MISKSLSRLWPFHFSSNLLLAFLFFHAPSTDAIDWQRHSFTLPESIWSAEAIDIDGDKKLELIAMGESKVFALTLQPNIPGQPVTASTRVLFDSREPKMLYCIRIDADNDGDLDLALGRYRVPWIEYRQALASEKPLPKPQGPDFSLGWIENTQASSIPWPLHVIHTHLNGIHGLAAADLNHDGLADLAATSIMGPTFPNSVLWFQASKSKTNPFRIHAVTQNGADGRPHYLEVADINRDGQPDLLLGDSQGGTFTWWEQKPNSTWQRNLVAQEKGATNIRAADLNNDGSIDIAGSCGHGKGVFYFQAPNWTRIIIDPDLPSPHALALGDFDRDGDTDVATASFTAFAVRWYENTRKNSFLPHDIDTGHQQQAYDLKTIDVDADGRPDLVLAGRESRNLVWYQNLKPD